MSQLASRINKKLLTMILASTTICAGGVPVASALFNQNNVSVQAATVNVTKVQLTALIKQATSINAAWHTANTFKVLQNTLLYAKWVNNKRGIAQWRINDAANKLRFGIKQLSPAKAPVALPVAKAPVRQPITNVNLWQVKQGNFSSIAGNWRLVATAHGSQGQLRSGQAGQLVVANNRLAGGGLVIKNQALYDARGSHAIAYTLNNQMLAMYVIAENAPISWEMVIQPKGTPNNYYVDGKKLGTQHDLIYLWNGINKTVQIYAR